MADSGQAAGPPTLANKRASVRVVEWLSQPLLKIRPRGFGFDPRSTQAQTRLPIRSENMCQLVVSIRFGGRTKWPIKACNFDIIIRHQRGQLAFMGNAFVEIILFQCIAV